MMLATWFLIFYVNRGSGSALTTIGPFHSLQSCLAAERQVKHHYQDVAYGAVDTDCITGDRP